jgi:hypothetical protein
VQELARVSGGIANWSIVVKEITMGWFSRLRASGKPELADPWNETIINGAPYDAHKAIRSSPAAPGDGPDADTLEEIKRRQVSLAVRYVVAVRAR